MRHSLILLAAAACAPPATGPAPSNPGVGIVEATFFKGDPFVPAGSDLVYQEVESETKFNLVGQAFEGEWADDRVQLAVLPAVTAFWFAWSTHHPGASVWENGVNNQGIELQATDGCGVPCDEIIPGCSGGQDCIPSIDDPFWVIASEEPARVDYLVDSDRVLGIARGAAARAYPLDALWTHEIVNDTWGDWTFSATYCPLTGSGVLVDGEQAGQDMQFGVSGNLYNSNLVMYDRTTESLYGQMRLVGFTGPRLGEPLGVAGLIDTTWGQWQRMYPHTEALDKRHTSSYPYGDYRSDHDDTFMANNPSPDPKYPNKSYAIGLTSGGQTTIWAFEELAAQLGDRGIVQDVVGELPVLVAWDAAGPTAVVLSRLMEGETLEFTPL